MAERIDTADAAERLGVKRETLYAYVSRGLLTSEREPGGKGSTFDAAEIDRLRRRRSDRRPGRLEVVVGSSITDVRDGRVTYRGHTIEDLVAEGHAYETTAELLWSGSLVVPEPWGPPRSVAKAVRRAAAGLPKHATATDRMMAGVVAAGATDPFRDDRTVDGVARMGRSLLPAIVDALSPPGSDDDAPLAARLWATTTQEPVDGWPLLDRALVLLADHGMATSTMAARLAASTRAGPHAALLAALGTVAGPLHGAASRRVHRMLVDAEERGVDAAIAEVMHRDGRIAGFGHFIHRSRDPRHDLLIDALMDGPRASARREVVAELGSRVAARVPVPPNVDFALGALTYATGMGPDAGELIFAVARTAGWLAHCLEEYDEAPLRFRPVGRYRSG